jgi:nicotinate dehydrogenase subunit A
MATAAQDSSGPHGGGLCVTVNGIMVALSLPAEVPLLHALRDGLGLFGTRFGCGEEQCGACMVLVDGQPSCACTRSLGTVEGRSVVTVEGLGTEAAPALLQRAFLEEQAGQCGFCLSGILISAAALLARNPDPDDAEIRAALEPHLCRCGAHNRMIRAVRRAARQLSASQR